jgi:hypothetical protein
MTLKYQKYLQEMYDSNQELFADFDDIHAKYILNRAKFQDEYNESGKQVMRVVEEWENKLCSRMEKGKNSSFSHRLADKFRSQLRVRFPLIDFIGVTTRRTTPSPPSNKDQEDFDIPKIKFG